jgi:hypothetical protein
MAEPEMAPIEQRKAEAQDQEIIEIAKTLLQTLKDENEISPPHTPNERNGPSHPTTASPGRTRAIGLLDQLNHLLRGPHEYLHDFVAQNWDHGALYAALQCRVFDHIYESNGSAVHVAKLSEQSKVPEEKLRRLLGLLRCKDFVSEPADGTFALTAVSRHLMVDGTFRAWVEFQYVFCQ